MPVAADTREIDISPGSVLKAENAFVKAYAGGNVMHSQNRLCTFDAKRLLYRGGGICHRLDSITSASQEKAQPRQMYR